MSQPPEPGRTLMALGVFPYSLVCVKEGEKEREREREGGREGEKAGLLAISLSDVRFKLRTSW